MLFKKSVCVVFVFVFCLSALAFKSGAAEEIYAKSAVVIDADTKQVLYQKDAHARRSMASTTKIMTALLALENEDRYKEFEVDYNAICVEGSSMGLIKGDKASLYALAVGMLTVSGNDAANAAAVRLAGSVEEFSKLMNDRAKKIGMKNTSFKTPSGLDDENHYSTAYDMALLGAEAIKNPEFLKICSSKKFSVTYSSLTRTYYNHNKLLSSLEGCIGIKTGFTKKSGRCLVSAVKRGERTLVCVTLNSSSDWNDHKKLYQSCFSSFSKTDLQPLLEERSQQIVNSQKAEVSLRAASLPEILTRQGEKVELCYYTRPFEFADVLEGEWAGVCAVKINGEKICEFDLLYDSSAVRLNEKNTEQKQSLFEKLKKWLISLFK